MAIFKYLPLLLCLHLPAWGHKASDSYVVVHVQAASVTAQWDIAVRDIDFAMGLDADGNGEVTWGELRSRQADIAAWALSRLQIERGGPCPLVVSELLVDSHTDGAYAVLKLDGLCPQRTGTVGLAYRLLFDVDSLHRGLLKMDVDGQTSSTVLSPTSGQLFFGVGQASDFQTFQQYFVEGVWHIWMGFDHVLFLLCLLLPAVLIFKPAQQSWQGANHWRPSVNDVLAVVTSFTLAHSITLSLAALGWVSLPSRWVESAIALSVLLAALNNLKPVMGQRRWQAAFLFGLVHGFGFASVLAELGLPASALVTSLLGFNVGVEAGQLVIVCVFFPLAYASRNTWAYQKMVFVGGSLVAACVALVWLLERSLDVQLLTNLSQLRVL